MVKAAIVQFNAYFDKEKNIAKAKSYVREAAASDAKLICLQELFSTVYFCVGENPAYRELAEPIPGPTTEEMAEVAQETGVVLVAPMYEKTSEDEYYNTAAILGPDGKLMGKYRKNSIPFNEKFYFQPGNLGFPVFPTPFGLTIGVLICYDHNFPEAARVLALKGADLIFVPTAAWGYLPKHVWEIGLRAHSVENLYYVGGLNRVGKDHWDLGDKPYYGDSMFVNPKGEIIARAGGQNDEIIYADIDLEMIKEVRDDWGFFRDRRPDLYHPLVE